MKKKTVYKYNSHVINIIRNLYLFLIFLFPLFKGLFFEEYYLPSFIIIGVLTLGYIFKSKDKSCLDELDVLLLSISVFYLCSTIWAANPYQSLISFLKHGCYFMTFFLARRIIKQKKEKERFFYVIISSLTISSIISILTAAKVLNFTDAYADSRIYGTVQYPNTFAALLIVAILINFVLYIEETNQNKKAVLILPLLINSVALIGTLSRGGMLIYIISAISFILLFRHVIKLADLLLIIIINILAAGVITLTGSLGNQYVMILTLACVPIILMLNYAKRKRFGNTILILIVAALSLIGIVYLFRNKSSVLGRILNIDISGSSSNARFVFYRDALEIFKNNWLIGTGGGGWESLYRTIQSYLYDTTEIHSSLLQYLVETGIVGVSIIIAFIILFLVKVRKTLVEGKDIHIRVCMLSIFAMALHSLIDFDFTITYYPLLLCAIAGILVPNAIGVKGKQKYGRTILGLFVVFMVFISASAQVGGYSYRKIIDMGKPLTLNQIEAAIPNVKLATILSPLNQDYINYLGQLYVAKGIITNKQEVIIEGEGLIDKSIRMEPTNYKLHLNKGHMLLQAGNIDAASSCYENIIDIMPMQHTGYEYATSAYVQAALEKNEKRYLFKAIEIYEQAQSQMDKVNPHYLQNWSVEYLDQSAFTNLQVGKANVLLTNYELGLKQLRLAYEKGEDNLKLQIAPWLVVCEEKLGKTPSFSANEEDINMVKKTVQEFSG